MTIVTFNKPITVSVIRTTNDDRYFRDAVAIVALPGGHGTADGDDVYETITAISADGTAYPVGTMQTDIEAFTDRISWPEARDRYWSPANRIPLRVTVARSNIRAITEED